MVGNIGGLLGLDVAGQVLGLDSIRAEPEVLLGVDEVPETPAR